MSNFIEKCLDGLMLPDDIDDFIDSWHEQDGDEPLYHFLGMTKKEYSLWVADPDVLPYIINAHYSGKNVSVLLEEADTLPLAARSESPIKAVELMQWLKSKGMWD